MGVGAHRDAQVVPEKMLDEIQFTPSIK